MIDVRTAFLVAGLGLCSASPTQEPETRAPETAASPQQPEHNAGHWIDRLGSESYRTRLEAEKALRKLGKSALPDLQKAVESTEDHEVQWRARRLIRQIENGDQGLQQRPQDDRRRAALQPLLRLQGGRAMPESIEKQFEELFRDMELRFGLDIPRGRFFQDDFFQDLRDQMQAGSKSQGLSMQIGPDGAVRVEIKETGEDGKVETKVYEAPDMETFQQQYPDVLGKNGLGFSMQSWPFGAGQMQMQPWSDLRLRTLPFAAPDVDLAPAAVTPVPEGKRLGVVVREIPEGVREYLEIEEGAGLMVDSVQPGTLAEKLGLQPGDIVLRIAGTQIGSPQDVQQALGGIDAGGDVEVRFLRKGVEKSATAKKPEASAPAEAPTKPRLQRRKTASDDGIR